jgi:hypothetical protein
MLSAFTRSRGDLRILLDYGGSLSVMRSHYSKQRYALMRNQASIIQKRLKLCFVISSIQNIPSRKDRSPL